MQSVVRVFCNWTFRTRAAWVSTPILNWGIFWVEFISWVSNPFTPNFWVFTETIKLKGRHERGLLYSKLSKKGDGDTGEAHTEKMPQEHRQDSLVVREQLEHSLPHNHRRNRTWGWLALGFSSRTMSKLASVCSALLR